MGLVSNPVGLGGAALGPLTGFLLRCERAQAMCMMYIIPVQAR
jgi:hypothetical protein